jgi:hypothetical protein
MTKIILLFIALLLSSYVILFKLGFIKIKSCCFYLSLLQYLLCYTDNNTRNTHGAPSTSQVGTEILIGKPHLHFSVSSVLDPWKDKKDSTEQNTTE